MAVYNGEVDVTGIRRWERVVSLGVFKSSFLSRQYYSSLFTMLMVQSQQSAMAIWSSAMIPSHGLGRAAGTGARPHRQTSLRNILMLLSTPCPCMNSLLQERVRLIWNHKNSLWGVVVTSQCIDSQRG